MHDFDFWIGRWHVRNARLRSRPGFVGMTVRLFDRMKQQWSIHWADNVRGTFEPPVVGGFENLEE